MSTHQTLPESLPDHVPAELFWNHNFDNYCLDLDDPFLAAARLHDGPDILWVAGGLFGKPGWVVTRKLLIEEVFRDPEHFSSDRDELTTALGVSWKLNPLEYDPPEHHRYRKLLNPYFTPQAVSELDSAVASICSELIGKFEHCGGCEFIEDFAEKFPSYVFLDLMGLPREMLPDFLAWERDMMRGADVETRLKAMQSIRYYLEGFLDEQKIRPRSELLKGLFSARMDDGRMLTRDEIMGMCYLLYIGGLDTVYSTLGWIFRHLATDLPLQDRLRRTPADIPQAVEEFFRAFPVARPHRRVKKDVVFHGVSMKVGDIVLLPTWMAGRDPMAYENPHRIDIDRNSRHVTFATGPHICLGVHLAKRELKTVINAFVSRFSNIRMPEGESCAYHTGGTLGVDRLPLEWD